MGWKMWNMWNYRGIRVEYVEFDVEFVEGMKWSGENSVAGL